MDDSIVYQNLLDALRPHARLLVAYSGGVDSALVLKAALDAAGSQRVFAVTADSPSLARRELDLACKLATKLGAEHLIVSTRELDLEGYRKNEGERCYFCKGELYGEIAKLTQYTADSVILNGANADDSGDFRPGMRAAREAGVISPLLEHGIDKAAVRRLARMLGIEAWDKPSSPCLASRIPYYSPVDANKLRQIEQAEEILHREGFQEVRVRHFGSVARIEVPPHHLRILEKSPQLSTVFADLENLGFATVEIDPEGLVSGKLNRSLASSSES